MIKIQQKTGFNLKNVISSWNNYLDYFTQLQPIFKKWRIKCYVVNFKKSKFAPNSHDQNWTIPYNVQRQPTKKNAEKRQ